MSIIYFKANGKCGYILPSKRVEVINNKVYLWEPNLYLHTMIDLPLIRGGFSFKDEDGTWKTYLETR